MIDPIASKSLRNLLIY